MRPLKPTGRAEPSLTRKEVPEAQLYAEPPLRRPAAPEGPRTAPLHLRADEVRTPAPAFARVFSAAPPVLGEAPLRPAAPIGRIEPAVSSNRWPEDKAAVDRPEPAAAEAAMPDPGSRKRIGIPRRWLETRSEARARKEREALGAQEEGDLPLTDVALPEAGLTRDRSGRAAYSASEAAQRPGAQSHAAALAWVGAGEAAAAPKSFLPPQSAGRAEPMLSASDEVWTPVLPGHSSLRPGRAAPSIFPALETGPSRAAPRSFGGSFGAASDEAVAAARYWPKDPRPAQPDPAVSLDDDEDDVPFRPWLHPDPNAESWTAAIPGTWGSEVRPRSSVLQARAEPSTSGPWEANAGHDVNGAQAFAAEADEPGWDRFYAEPTPPVRAFAPGAAHAAIDEVPEAPMIEARAPRRDSSRRDPAPSRTAYRLQRMWLTPLYRALLRKGLPAFVLVFACGVALQDEGRREAIVTWASDIRASITERPEFMLTEVKIEGTSAETAEAVRQALALQLPVSSFDLELPALQEKAATVSSVASAALYVRSGGVLEVQVVERNPVVVWRSETGIGTLDQTGHQVATLQNRLERPDLPLIVGIGAETAVPEALRIYQAAGPIRDRVRGLIRVGERRWDLVVDPAIRVMLPAKDPVPALEQVVALHQAQQLLDRDITAVDLRNPARATVRMGEPAAETWRLNLAAQKGK